MLTKSLSALRRCLALAAVSALLFVTPVPLHAQGFSAPYAYWVPPGNCWWTSTSATASAAVDGASSIPVVKISNAGAGATTHTLTLTCHINPPNWVVTSTAGLRIVDAIVAYSPQTQITTTQTSSLVDGTYNSVQVFQYLAYPTASVNETASTITPTRADSGTMTITPLTSQFNGTTQTAGAYFTIKFTPATNTLTWANDGRDLILKVAFVTASGLTTVVTSPGVLVHYQ